MNYSDYSGIMIEEYIKSERRRSSFMIKYATVILIGYIFGLFQTSYLLGKLFYKVDVRTLGRGNAGASNASESLGIRFGVLVGAVDIIKAVLSILLIKMLYDVTFDMNGSGLLYLNGLGVILGHNFPFYMGFKGGKGTASLIGMLLGINLLFGLGGMAIITVFSLVSDFIAVGTLSLVLYVVIVTGFMAVGWLPFAIAVLIGMMSLFLHRKNFVRIFKKEESRVSRVLRKKNKKI